MSIPESELERRRLVEWSPYMLEGATGERIMNWSLANLKQEYERAVAKGWLPLIAAAVAGSHFSVADLLGVGSRETNLDPQYQQHSGDRGRGFSMWQIDIGSFPEWIATGDWKSVGKAAKKAVEVLEAKRGEVQRLAAQHKYTLSSDRLKAVTLAAYNHGSKGSEIDEEHLHNPDRGTTGHNYSSDTLNRIAVFERLEKGAK